MKLLQTSEPKAFTATLERPATPGLPAPSTRSSAPCALKLSVPNPPAAGLEGAPATGRREVFQDLMIVNAINLELFSLRSQSKSSLRTSQKTPIPNPPNKKNQKTRQFSPRHDPKWLPNHGFPHESCFSPRFGIQSLVQGAPGAVVLAKNWRCTVYKKINRCIPMPSFQ